MADPKLRAALDRAKQYIGAHLGECCQEVLDFHATASLCPGRVRAAARMYAEVSPANSLKMALDEVAMQAMERVART